MGEINVLPKNVAELIAAGEVIERPASVVKELLENSIDAGASEIMVEIKKGGVSYIRVTDNGKGIMQEDVQNAFLRHATSKIRESDDLDNISTLGFRGEALASIAAVSKLDIMTKNINELDGTHYGMEGGEKTAFNHPVACPQGTTIVVRDLFYNVPARMKFLKKDVSEGNAVVNLVERIALSHPEIKFYLRREDKRILTTPGDGNLENAIAEVFGLQFGNSLIPVKYELGGISLRGFITKPEDSVRANRTMQMFYINGRYVRTRTAMTALEQAYKGYVTVGKYPSCVLFLDMNCNTLDVNVHPSKLEVRFTNERPVYDVVYHAVRNAVLKFDPKNDSENPLPVPKYTNPKLLAPTAERGSQLGFVYGKKPDLPLPDKNSQPLRKPSDLSKYFNLDSADDTPKTNPKNKDSDAPSDNETFKAVFDEQNQSQSQSQNQPLEEKSLEDKNTGTDINIEPDKDNNYNNSFSGSVESTPIAEALKEDEEVTIVDSAERSVPMKYVGEAFSTYIIIEYGSDKLMFIDKHAAHERLIYERLKKQHKTSAPQLLLEPIVVTLDRDEIITVLENKEAFMQTGFEIDGFGDGKIIIRSVPIMLETSDITESFHEMSDYLHKHKKLILSEKMEWIYANTACRAAIKGGNVSHPEELIDLALTLEKNPEIRTCPHGRPIYFIMKKSQLEKSFKRTV